MILGLVDEAVSAGARQSLVCAELGIDIRTLQRWRAQNIGEDRRAGPKSAPKNKLTAKERARLLEIVNRPENRDLSPKQIVPKLADEGIYIASESTLYRILREEKQLKHRGPSRPPQKRYRPKPQLATGPNQVWSWDITYLKSPIRGAFYYLYLVVDVWSRKIVGFAVHESECAERASSLIEAACRREGVRRDQVVLHSDNGGPMKAATMLATLQGLGVTTSFSRPRVSNDNPFSEALFRTAKYRPEYPKGPFESLEKAAVWVDWFVGWYNTEHRHSAIRFVTPTQRHQGLEVEVLEGRRSVYGAARSKRPERWSGEIRNWEPIEEVVLNPGESLAALEAV